MAHTYRYQLGAAVLGVGALWALNILIRRLIKAIWPRYALMFLQNEHLLISITESYLASATQHCLPQLN